MSTAIWWIRRDLRLSDNAALAAATQRYDHVIPVFVLDERLLTSRFASQRRTAFLFDSLRSLAKDIDALGGELIIRSGEPEKALADICCETEAGAIYAERGYSPYAATRDARVAARLPLKLVDGITALPLGSVLKRDGGPYTVYTPYSRKWKQAWLEHQPERNSSPTQLQKSPGLEQISVAEALPRINIDHPEPGESQARRILADFTGTDGAIYRYGAERDLPVRDATSRLSAHLRFGTLSAADAVRAAYRAIDLAPSSEARAERRDIG